MKPIEKVAKALWERRSYDEVLLPSWEYAPELSREEAIADARAALQALIEVDLKGPSLLTEEAFRVILRRMIEEAEPMRSEQHGGDDHDT